MPFIMEELSEPLTVDHDTLVDNCNVEHDRAYNGIGQLRCPRLIEMDYV